MLGQGFWKHWHPCHQGFPTWRTPTPSDNFPWTLFRLMAFSYLFLWFEVHLLVTAAFRDEQKDGSTTHSMKCCTLGNTLGNTCINNGNECTKDQKSQRGKKINKRRMIQFFTLLARPKFGLGTIENHYACKKKKTGKIHKCETLALLWNRQGDVKLAHFCGVWHFWTRQVHKRQFSLCFPWAFLLICTTG